jgi:hypothetical protein
VRGLERGDVLNAPPAPVYPCERCGRRVRSRLPHATEVVKRDNGSSPMMVCLKCIEDERRAHGLEPRRTRQQVAKDDERRQMLLFTEPYSEAGSGIWQSEWLHPMSPDDRMTQLRYRLRVETFRATVTKVLEHWTTLEQISEVLRGPTAILKLDGMGVRVTLNELREWRALIERAELELEKLEKESEGKLLPWRGHHETEAP